jgi:hypothetical protein
VTFVRWRVLLALPLALCLVGCSEAVSRPGSSAEAPGEVTSQPSASAEVPGEMTTHQSANCGAKDHGLNVGEAKGAVADKARQIHQAVVACDEAALVRIASEDATELGNGLLTPQEMFAMPDTQNRYDPISRLLSVRPGIDEDGNVFWPWRDPVTGAPDADELEEAGLGDGGYQELGIYIGWFMRITAQGQFESLGAGN